MLLHYLVILFIYLLFVLFCSLLFLPKPCVSSFTNYCFFLLCMRVLMCASVCMRECVFLSFACLILFVHFARLVFLFLNIFFIVFVLFYLPLYFIFNMKRCVRNSSNKNQKFNFSVYNFCCDFAYNVYIAFINLITKLLK